MNLYLEIARKIYNTCRMNKGNISITFTKAEWMMLYKSIVSRGKEFESQEPTVESEVEIVK